jgi:anti-anti-sigma factor
MSDTQQPTYLVSAYSDPVVVRVNGKANYLNCNAFRDFVEQMVRAGKQHIALDFENCKGMDSTFLGILAGTAIDLRKQTPEGKLTLCNLSERNYELITNLGLQNLLSLERECDRRDGVNFEGLRDESVKETRDVLQAHQNLAEADDSNAERFQDVIAFLKNQVEQEKNS